MKELGAGLEAQMDAVIAELKRNTETMHELKHSIDLMKATTQADNDRRYRLKDELLKDALAVLDDPLFIGKVEPIVCRIIDAHACKTRDSILSWLNFIRVIGGLIVAYVAYSIIANQSTIMQTLSHIK